MIVVVQQYGTSVGKRSNCLVIKNAKEEKEISTDKIEELHLFPSCSISSDAVQLCMKKDVWIIFLNKFGEPDGEIVPFSGGSSPIYKRNQLLLTHHPQGVELVKRFLVQKIKNQIRHLKNIRRNKRNSCTIQILDKSIAKMTIQMEQIQKIEGADMDAVRFSLQGYEGNAGKSYYEAINYLLPEDMKFTKRQRNADDIFNCALNYLYGILYAKVKKMAYQCRLDPYIGIMHVDSYNKPTFVYDFIEGQRIICEELVFNLCFYHKITWADIDEVTEQGLCFSEEARKLLVCEFYKKMKEKCYFKKKQVTIEKRIYLEMLEVAQEIGGMETDVLAAV